MVEIRTITVLLGEKEYKISEAGFMRAKPWKKRLIEEIKPLFQDLEGATGITFETAADLSKLLPVVERIFIDSIEMIFELLISYSPTLEEDREYIANNATDNQIFSAFQNVVGLADFLGLIKTMNRRIGL